MHICLVNLPRYEIHRPPLGLAILSSICDAEQVDYDCVDIGLKIWQQLPNEFHAIDTYCITRQIDSECLTKLNKLLETVVTEVLTKHPDTTFALSLLSTWSHPICELFCKIVKRLSSAEIVIGGQGLIDQQWTEGMKEQHLIDHYLVGEGEIIFRKYLQGERTGAGINNYNFEQIDDLDAYCVIPNYTKLLVNAYPYLNNEPAVYVTASRGCVRSCGYCDVGHLWKKYRYRGAQHVAQEMITQYERHGIQNFFFTDSLINGSMKMLNELCDVLIEYKQTHPDAKFKWQGQYIFRPKDLVKEAHIKRMAEAGVDYLIVGLETGSDRVRLDMNKNHSTDDAEWFLEMFKKYGISCHLLMITGWVTETIEDHNATLALFPKWQKYVASGTITGIELGSTLNVIEHSPIGNQINELEITFINNKPYLWQSGKNPDLTIAERVRRRIETHKEAMKYHWPITRSQYRLETIKRWLIEAVTYLKSNPAPKFKRTFKISSS